MDPLNDRREHGVRVITVVAEDSERPLDVPGGPRLVISGAAGAPQYFTLHPRYGYHRVTVDGAETRVEFVEVNKGEQSQADNALSHPATCPKIENADVD